MSYAALFAPFVLNDWDSDLSKPPYKTYRHRHSGYGLRLYEREQEICVMFQDNGIWKHAGEFYGACSLESLAHALMPPSTERWEEWMQLLSFVSAKAGAEFGQRLQWSRWSGVFDAQNGRLTAPLPPDFLQHLLKSLNRYSRITSQQGFSITHAVQSITFTVPTSQHALLELFHRLQDHPWIQTLS